MQEAKLKIGAVLLAAGEGSRMGGVPKCLLVLDGVPLIQRHLVAMQSAGIDEVVVVTGYYHQQIEPMMADFPARIVRNPHPEAGQQSSVEIGIGALVATFDIVVIVLADQPLVGGAELAELIAAFRTRTAGTQIVYPRVQATRGNPVLFSGELIARMLTSNQKTGLRKFIDEHPQLVHVHETANDRFILDLDTREDIDAFEKRTGHRLLMPAVVGG